MPVCAKVCEAQHGVAECVTVSCEEEPVVNVLKRHDCHALASVAIEGFKDFGKYLRQWAERCSLEPVAYSSYLESEVLTVTDMKRDVVVRIAEVDARRVQV